MAKKDVFVRTSDDIRFSECRTEKLCCGTEVIEFEWIKWTCKEDCITRELTDVYTTQNILEEMYNNQFETLELVFFQIENQLAIIAGAKGVDSEPVSIYDYCNINGDSIDEYKTSRIKWIGLFILACMLAMYGSVQGIVFLEKAGMLGMAVSGILAGVQLLLKSKLNGIFERINSTLKECNYSTIGTKQLCQIVLHNLQVKLNYQLYHR